MTPTNDNSLLVSVPGILFHLTQGAVAIAFTGTICWITLQGHDIPPALTGALGTILGFYLSFARAGTFPPSSG